MAKELFTLKEAQQLRQCFLNLIEERDKLAQELEEHQLILSELETLRAFLDEDSVGAMALNGANNGYLTSSRGQESIALPTAADAAGVSDLDTHPVDAEHDNAGAAPQPEPATSAVVTNAEPSCRSEETPVADRCDEPDADKSDTGEAKPPAGTLLAQILKLIEASDRPKRPWQVQKELNLPRLPSAELSRLVAMGRLTRPKAGIYGIPGRDYGGSIQAKRD